MDTIVKIFNIYLSLKRLVAATAELVVTLCALEVHAATSSQDISKLAAWTLCKVEYEQYFRILLDV